MEAAADQMEVQSILVPFVVQQLLDGLAKEQVNFLCLGQHIDDAHVFVYALLISDLVVSDFRKQIKLVLYLVQLFATNFIARETTFFFNLNFIVVDRL